MKIVALYKCFDGPEFMEASLESIYAYVDHIVIVHSDVSWTGEHGNTVKPVVDEWIRKGNDIDDKVFQVTGYYRTQKEQYQTGVNFIQDHFDYDMVMLIDADEVWDKDNIERAIEYMGKTNYPVYSTLLWIYVKSIFYRVDPMFGDPTVFVRDANAVMAGPRGFTKDKHLIPDVAFHHFSAVRYTDADVRKKIETSFVGDGNGPGVPGLDQWFEDVWSEMPNVTNFHYFPECRLQNLWRNMKVVELEDLPKSLIGKRIFKQFYAWGVEEGE